MQEEHHEWFSSALAHSLAWMATEHDDEDPVSSFSVPTPPPPLSIHHQSSQHQQTARFALLPAAHARFSAAASATSSFTQRAINYSLPSCSASFSPLLLLNCVTRCAHDDVASFAVCCGRQATETAAITATLSQHVNPRSWMLLMSKSDSGGDADATRRATAIPVFRELSTNKNTSGAPPSSSSSCNEIPECSLTSQRILRQVRKTLVWASGEDKEGFKEEFGAAVLLPLAHQILCEEMVAMAHTSTNISSSSSSSSDWTSLAALATSIVGRFCSATSSDRLSVTFLDLSNAEQIADWLVQLISSSNVVGFGAMDDNDATAHDDDDDDAREQQQRFESAVKLLQLKRSRPPPSFVSDAVKQTDDGTMSSLVDEWLVRPSSSWAIAACVASSHRSSLMRHHRRSSNVAAFTAARLHALLQGNSDLLRATSILQRALLLDAARGHCALSASARALLCECQSFVLGAAISLCCDGARSSLSSQFFSVRDMLEECAAHELSLFPLKKLMRSIQQSTNREDAAAAAATTTARAAGVSGGRLFSLSTAGAARGNTAIGSPSSGPVVSAVIEIKKLPAEAARDLLHAALGVAGAECKSCGLHRCATVTTESAAGSPRQRCPVPGLIGWLLPTGLGQRPSQMTIEVEREYADRRKQRQQREREQQERQMMQRAAAIAAAEATTAAAAPTTGKQQANGNSHQTRNKKKSGEGGHVVAGDATNGVGTDQDAAAAAAPRNEEGKDQQSVAAASGAKEAVRRQRPAGGVDYSVHSMSRAAVDFFFRLSNLLRQYAAAAQHRLVQESDSSALAELHDLLLQLMVISDDSSAAQDIISNLLVDGDLPRSGSDFAAAMQQCCASELGNQSSLAARFISVLQNEEAAAAMSLALAGLRADQERQRGAMCLISVRNDALSLA